MDLSRNPSRERSSQVRLWINRGLLLVTLGVIGILVLIRVKNTREKRESHHPSGYVSSNSFASSIIENKNQHLHHERYNIDNMNQKKNMNDKKKIGLQGSSSKGVVDEGIESLPNFVVFLVDDQGYDDIGYNNEAIETPTIDGLAKNGLIVDKFYAMHLCTPARGAYLTGKYPIHTGLQADLVETTSPWGLSATKEQSLPILLQGAGYETHLIGKWHLGHAKEDFLPLSHGYDSYFGYVEAETTYITHQTTDDATSNRQYRDLMYGSDGSYVFIEDNSTRSDELYSTYASDLIEGREDPSKPFYLQMNFQNVHKPLPQIDPDDYTPDEVAYLKTFQTNLRARMAAAALKLDHAVNTVVEQLENMNMIDNTYIIYMSDNGGCYQAGGINLPFRGLKGHLFEGGVRTPSFISSPLLPSESLGQIYQNKFHITDWFPTILEYAGYTSDDLRVLNCTVDGVSHAINFKTGVANSTVSPPRDEVLLNYDDENDETVAALIVGDYKIIINEPPLGYYSEDNIEDDQFAEVQGACTDGANEESEIFLFNLAEDPYEQTNLYNDPTYSTVVAQLMERLQDLANSQVGSLYVPLDSTADETFDHVGYVCPWLDSDPSYYLPPVYKEEIL